ncbi:MAG: AAA family ATPase [Propionibacterium sp.]|nr:AAA family ATPase [Propionibacterium sp.]
MRPPTSDPLRIVRLTAENVKRLKAVEITPDGDLVTITGRNAQGKSSVLDAIWLALGGGAASKATTRPVRDGEDHARVTLDLGELTVTREWKGDRSTLTVASADGATYNSPQRVLDALVGRLSFDPLAFTRLSAREQRESLLDLVDLNVDLASLDAQRKALYDERTEVGRQGKAIGDVPPVDETLPSAEQSASDLIAQIRAAEERRRDIDRARADLDLLVKRGTEVTEAIARLQAELHHLGQQHAAEQVRLDAAPAPADTAALETQLADVEATNARIRANAAARDKQAAHAALYERYAALGDQISELDQAKARALASATFPVEGLGFDETGVTFKGVPFSQASSAEQIRVSLAMAMALNPTLRVIRILDGSLLDDDSMQMVADAAKEGGYQVWIERVSDPSESAIVIEDGEVSA